MIYGTKNRVDGEQLKQDFNATGFCKHPTEKAEDMRVTDFLPQQQDLECRKKYFRKVIKDILIDYMPAFQGLEREEIDHPYLSHLNEKSEVASLGVIDENPGTISGLSTVADQILANYIPAVDGKDSPIPIHGDAATVLMLYKAMETRYASFTPSRRYDRMWPVPTEFHRRMLHMQDTLNLFHKAESSGERGTLANIRTNLNIQVSIDMEYMHRRALCIRYTVNLKS
jgi:hypothetical protein